MTAGAAGASDAVALVTPGVIHPVSGAAVDTGAPPGGMPPGNGGGGGGFTAGGFGLERHQPATTSPNGPIDWAALVLAIIAPPLGFLVAIVAVIYDSRTKGFAAGIAKAAIVIAIVLSIIGGAGVAVFAKLHAEAAGQNAIVASSAAWCTQLKSNPATLASPTYGWPAPATTVPASETAIQAYIDYWTKLAAIAPAGIKAGTTQMATAASSLLSTIKSTQTIDDASNIQNMQTAVSGSGIGDWVAEYCK